MKIMTAFAAALVISTAAIAQPNHNANPEAIGHEGMPMMGMMQPHCALMGRTDGALAFLKTELAISPSQSKAWDDFEAVYRAEASSRSRGAMGDRGMMKCGKGPQMNEPFPRKIAHHLEMMESHHARAKKLAASAAPLYDALNANQRKTADELLMHFAMSHCHK
jgi:hypothetical protein